MPPALRRPLSAAPLAPLLALAALASACAEAPRQPWRDQPPPEVLIEVLPRAAAVTVDGAPLGPGQRAVPVPAAEHRYRFAFRAAGFAPAEREETGEKLAGTRLAVVLRPDGFGTARRLEPDDAPGLGAAAALLERRGDHAAALEFAERAIALAPDTAQAQRVAGDAAQALGRRDRAVQAYSAYLALAPGAPDRAAVAARIEALRGDLTVPPPPDDR